MKNLTIVLFSCFTLVLYAQDSLINSSIEVYQMSGFRFELHHQPATCPECTDCFCKDVFVYDSNEKLIHEQKIKGNMQYPQRMIDKMDVYDFNFDGFPDFRLVDYAVYYDTYYIYQPSSSNYVVDPYLSQCNTVIFYPNEKEVIGFYHGPLKVESDSLNQTSGFNIHRLCFKGVNLEQLTIESKIWHLPWNYPYWEDTLTRKKRYTRNCTYKNQLIEQIGDGKLTIDEFSLQPSSKDSINLRLKDEYHLQYAQPKIVYKEEIPSNFILYRDRAKDTIINNKKYNWVVYDMNKNPFEIGEDYSNGIKNGEWIKRDQHERIISVENYINDTLNGLADYYYYHNYPWNVTRISGLNVKGCKLGEWTYYQSGKFKSLEGTWIKDVVKTYDLNGIVVSRSDYSRKERIESTYFYSSKGAEIWFVSYDKKGRIIESLPNKEKVSTFDIKE
jgi:hypothetical protein